MRITCSWEKPLGTCYSQYDEEKNTPSRFTAVETYLQYFE